MVLIILKISYVIIYFRMIILIVQKPLKSVYKYIGNLNFSCAVLCAIYC